MYNWFERPTKADVRHRIGGDTPAVVYTIGKYEITVPVASEGDEPAITYRVPGDYHGRDPRHTFPNMEVCDGELRFPITDLVDTVLSRIEPAEIAQALWQNDEVKAAFMGCLAARFNEGGIEDGDRRTFLASVREAVHDVALDRLAGQMAGYEHELTRRAHHSDEVGRINETLREMGVQVPRSVRGNDGERTMQMVPLQFDDRTRSVRKDDGTTERGELDVIGRGWEEARNFWRAEVLKRFPASTATEEMGCLGPA